MTDRHDGWLTVKPDGAVQWQGRAGTMRLVERNETALIARVPGRRANTSGIRGMRNDRYYRQSTIAFAILGVEESGALRIRKLIEWDGK